MKLPLTLLTICLAIVGCSDSAEVSDTRQPISPTIAWFDGDVSSAFESARNLNKPVFLYWGAVWCPPCQEIKHTVFKSRRFIAQTGSFIPVYLDGDTDAAQLLGEKFGVRGYPTMIVFNPDGVEVTRIPGGIDISRYNDVLELAQNSISPTATLVHRVITDPDAITETDLKQLAYYSWGQDHDALPENYKPELFLTMSRLATDEVSSARLYMQYLYEVAVPGEEVQESQASEIVPIAGAIEKVNSILDSDNLSLACWDSIAYNAGELLPYIAAEDDRDELEIKWQERTLVLSKDPSLSAAEQLAGLLPALAFFFSNDSTNGTDETPVSVLDPELKQIVLQATRAADRTTTNSFARQSVVNQIRYLLTSARLVNEAKQLLLAELQRSESPYYFMSSLAAIEEKQGNDGEAIEWRRRAYENSVGAATRFQWGGNYVKALIRLQPENEALIVGTSVSLINEFEPTAGVFAGRNFKTLKSLNVQLNHWQPDDESELLAGFNKLLSEQCTTQVEGSLEAINCESLFNPSTRGSSD